MKNRRVDVLLHNCELEIMEAESFLEESTIKTFYIPHMDKEEDRNISNCYRYIENLKAAHRRLKWVARTKA